MIVTLADVMAAGVRAKPLLDAAALVESTFGRLDAPRARYAATVMRFFNAASDAYDAEIREGATETARSLVPGAHAERALDLLRALQSQLYAMGAPNDAKSACESIEKTRLWLEGRGWTLLPGDLPGKPLAGRTAAGVVADMGEYVKTCAKARAIMAEKIAECRKGARK